jgi:hypothetical protein
MKIKFLSNGPLGDVTVADPAYYSSYACVINMAYFMMKHYYSLYGKNSSVRWLPADLILLDDIDTIVDKISAEQPDVLALSIYVWNQELQFKIAKTIKEKFPKTIIVIGGPELTAHKNSNFFDIYSYVDYVVYGDGEQPLQQIIDYESGYIDTTDDFVNIVKNNQGSWHKFPHEQLRDELYFSTSPYLSQKDFIRDHIEYLESRGVPKKHMVIGIEFARGCMYNCSFCDWSQNLTKKVKRRKTTWQEELEFFKELDITLRETDANFGQWPEDLEIFDYAAEMYNPEKNFKFIVWNTPKLKKQATYHIMKKNAELYGLRMMISLQDINLSVLEKMDRPSLSWEDHKQLIFDLKTNTNASTVDLLSVQLMMGVAGQSYQSLTNTIRQIWTETNVYKYQINHWTLLSNSPGAELFYQALHRLKFIPVYVVNKNLGGYSTLESVYQAIKQGTDIRKHVYESNMVFSTSTMRFEEMIAVKILDNMLTKFIDTPSLISNDSLWDSLTSNALSSANNQYQDHLQLSNQYGFIVYGSYDAEKSTINKGWKYLEGNHYVLSDTKSVA